MGALALSWIFRELVSPWTGIPTTVPPSALIVASGALLGDHLEDDRLEVRLALVRVPLGRPVVVVAALQDHLGGTDDLLNHERAGADPVLQQALPPEVQLQVRLVQDRGGPVVGQDLQEPCVWLGDLHHERQLVDDGGTDIALPEGVRRDAQLRVAEGVLVEVVLDDLRGERVAVAEGDAGPEVEGVAEVVGADRPGLRQPGVEGASRRVLPDQPVSHARGDVGVGPQRVGGLPRGVLDRVVEGERPAVDGRVPGSGRGGRRGAASGKAPGERGHGQGGGQ